MNLRSDYLYMLASDEQMRGPIEGPGDPWPDYLRALYLALGEWDEDVRGAFDGASVWIDDDGLFFSTVVRRNEAIPFVLLTEERLR